MRIDTKNTIDNFKNEFNLNIKVKILNLYK